MLTKCLRIFTNYFTFFNWKAALMGMIVMPFMTFAQNQAPEVSNVAATNNEGDGTVTVTYDLSDAEDDDVEVIFRASADGGTTFMSNESNVSGDVGYPVTPGTSKEITWDYNDSISTITNYQVNLVANDRQEVDVQSIVNQVDSQRLESNLEVIAGNRHKDDGLAHLNEVKDSIESRFGANGLVTNRHGFTFQGYDAHNIIGSKNGLKAADTTYIIDAHFDGVQGSPGADDNGSGVAGLLEAARILSNYHFDHTIKFIGFDQEETGNFRLGSKEYVATQISNETHIGGVFNFEMIGYSTSKKNTQNFPPGFEQIYPDVYSEVEADSFRGDFIANVANGESEGIMAAYDSAASWYVPGLDVVSIGSPLFGPIPPDLRRSDHASFWDSGHVALMLTNTADFRNPNYHTAQDTIGYFDYTFMTNVVKATIGAICEEAQIMNSTSASTMVSNPTNIQQPNQANASSVKIFPNPANDNKISIRFDGSLNSQIQLKVYNTQGKLMLDQSSSIQGNQKIRLNTNQLNAGIYHLEVNDGHQTINKKLVIE